MAIDITKKEDIALEFHDGYARTEVLKGVYPLVKTYKCLLKAGHTAEPERYSDKIQVFSFTSGSIYAAEDMEIVLWVIDMLESDRAAYEDTHMVLPSFKRFSECEPYDQSCKGPHTQSWTVIADGNLARVLMGVVKAEGEGTKERGHAEVAQWNYCLPGSDFHFTVEEETVNHSEGDFSYVTAGLDHSLIADPGKTVFYIWFEHWVEEKKINPQSYEAK